MLVATLALGAIVSALDSPPLFTPEDKSAVIRYWCTPGRYSVTPPKDFKTKGLWQVRLTVEGSTWLWNFNKARGLVMKPTADSAGDNKAWDEWIDAKVNHDRWVAAQVAIAANTLVTGNSPKSTDVPTDEPENPGPMPADMLEFVKQPYVSTVRDAQVQNPPPGDPPTFAEAVVPMEHRIKFDDGTELAYQDNTKMRAKYAYYRSDRGIISAGKPVKSLPAKDLDALIKLAQISPSEAKVMKAVSILEGGFDSVNTYDTGYVSVGFIQFASLRDGAGSLGKMLLSYKTNDPEEFQKDFRRFGLDVTPDGSLSCLNWQTGYEAQGPEANRQIIEDKRMIAVFQRAGQKSPAFNAAQIRTAKNLYYPSQDTIDIGTAGISLVGKVSEFIKSEAGMATLMDRKVNTGSFGPLAPTLQRLAIDKGLKKFSDFAKYEREIISALKYRKDYLADKTLSQPK